MRKFSLIAVLLMLTLTAVPATAGEDAPDGHGSKDSLYPKIGPWLLHPIHGQDLQGTATNISDVNRQRPGQE